MRKEKDKALTGFALDYTSYGDSKIAVAAWLHSEAFPGGCFRVDYQPSVLMVLLKMNEVLEEYCFIQNPLRLQIENLAGALALKGMNNHVPTKGAIKNE